LSLATVPKHAKRGVDGEDDQKEVRAEPPNLMKHRLVFGSAGPGALTMKNLIGGNCVKAPPEKLTIVEEKKDTLRPGRLISVKALKLPPQSGDTGRLQREQLVVFGPFRFIHFFSIFQTVY